MNKELENKALEIIQKLRTYNPVAGDDPRIHKNANCRYSDKRDYLDIVYELIKEGMLKSSFYKR